MIDIDDVIKIHKILIDHFGGSHGLRDKNSLNSAISRPFATFDQKELYPETIDKAVAILESIVTNHPFVDGNKRTGYVLARLFLLREGFDIEATQNEKYEMVISVSNGTCKYEQIKDWFSKRYKNKRTTT